MKFTMPIIYVVQGSHHEMISFQTEQSIMLDLRDY